MKYKNIEITNKNYISVITINRPKFLNALNIATIQELSKALFNIERNKVLFKQMLKNINCYTCFSIKM